MSKKSEREYLNSLQGSSSKTFVLKKGSNELKEVISPKKSPNPLDALFNRNTKPIGTVNTMERKILEDKMKQKSFAFLTDIMADSADEPLVAEAIAAALQAEAKPDSLADATEKFTFDQKLESIKTGIVGLLSGGVAVTPVAFLHDYCFPGTTIPNGLAQWEFDTDTGSLAAALFAIVYRYSVRDGEEKNEMLPLGVIGAFAIVRTLSRVRVSYYCDAIPLDCGAPFGYFDWSMTQQAAFSGLESIFLFGATAVAMEYCYKKEYISRFK